MWVRSIEIVCLAGCVQVIGNLVCKDCEEPELQFAPGVSALPWRDGTSYPSSIPKADISIQDGENGNSFVMISIITIGVILILLLMFVGLGYFRIHSHLKQVAAEDIDIESPIAKAISLLKVTGSLLFLPVQCCFFFLSVLYVFCAAIVALILFLDLLAGILHHVVSLGIWAQESSSYSYGPAERRQCPCANAAEREC